MLVRQQLADWGTRIFNGRAHYVMSLYESESPQIAAAHRAAQELKVVAAITERLPQEALEGQSVLPGWSIRDLLQHTAEGAVFLAECLQAYIGEPEERQPQDDDLAVSLRASAQFLVDVAEKTWHITPSAAAPIYGRKDGMPMSMLIDILDFEFATHSVDLHWSLGAPVPLGGAAVAAVLRLFGEHLHRLGQAGTPPQAPVSFTLHATDGPFEVSVAFEGGAWSRLDCEGDINISGRSDALALLILGRITAADPWLSTTGELSAACEFSSYFPGPS
ncbi:maleylpyruvate isomerase family mycothiol-dependent enzyme [Streptomyces sp. NBC_00233]|uniref:maleylpyruvate isomerase family mycothiol-dependent enzyme n=1 Tax=Streptomyces sp. NBC_00233 TaxID=2975686 RepID=UPI002256A501|nr:maleylpyruvate isomerase family mycothiol-dependent enzyme [Streptomyces sp. NBC_00233]MCX5233426.1 maleylpyruvate isomerase family mycothiol-dependent enzyme [Streptomyces sp. NBC_00233]